MRIIKRKKPLYGNECHIDWSDTKNPFVNFNFNIHIRFNKAEKKLMDNQKGYIPLGDINFNKQTKILIRQLAGNVAKEILSNIKNLKN